jgi:acetoacetyl-CoA reductase
VLHRTSYPKPLMNLSGADTAPRRIALVTGGIGGLGTAICKRLARGGCRVVALDRQSDDPRMPAFRDAVAGLDVRFEHADVVDADSVAAAVRRIVEEFGQIDILVNAAGITRDSRLTKMTVEQWDAVLRVNLDSVFHLCRHVVQGMCDRGFGRIVNISSVNGQTGQFGQTNYAAAKAGMHGFTMALAREVSRYGVTVNSVSPGYIDTDMTRAMRKDIRDQVLAAIPAARIGHPVDIANAVDFLCSDASGYVTGANIPVNGGLFMSF